MTNTFFYRFNVKLRDCGASCIYLIDLIFFLVCLVLFKHRGSRSPFEHFVIQILFFFNLSRAFFYLETCKLTRIKYFRYFVIFYS